MNLLMISGDRALASGKQGAFYNTLSELHKHFERIDIICPRVPIHRYNMVLFGNVYIHPSPWPSIFQWLWIRYQGARLIGWFAHQIITVQEYPFIFLGIGARWLNHATGVPYILEVHHIVGYPRAAGLRERLGRAVTRLVLPYTAYGAVAVRVVNAHQALEYVVATGVPSQKIVHIPSIYLDQDVFKPQEVEKQYDIAFVGRMAKNKGLDIFLDVMENAGLVGVCIGDGPMLDWARSQAKKRDLKIHFSGFVKDSTEVASYLNKSRLLLMTSYNEGGPRVVVEALACGVPVVATPVGIVPDVLPPECIEEWDSADLAAKVKNLLSDSELYNRIREAGLFTAGQFEKRSAIASYADALKNLAHG